MAFEVRCTACNGRMMVASGGTVVACPHCGAHVTVPADTPSEPPAADGPPPPLSSVISKLPDFTGDAVSPPDTSAASDEGTGEPSVSVTDDSDVSAAAAAEASDAESSDAESSETDSSEAEPADGESPVVAGTDSESSDDTTGTEPEEVPAAESAPESQPEEPAATPIIAATSTSVTDEPEAPASSPSPSDSAAALQALAAMGGTEEETPTGFPDFSGVQVDEEPSTPGWMAAAGATETSDEPNDFPAEFPDFSQRESEPAAKVETSADDAAPAEATAAVTPPTAPPAAAPVAGSEANATTGEETPADKSDTPEKSPAKSETSRPTSGRRKSRKGGSDATVPRSRFVIVASYASAVTIALLYMLMNYGPTGGNQHALESLPDLVPPMKENRIAFNLVPEEATMPPGHTLSLGETRRFGNLEVTPLKVTRGMLDFVPFQGGGQAAGAKPNVGPVLKLWLKVRNVSDDQLIPPFGEELALKRVLTDGTFEYRANNFLAPLDEKTRDGHRVLLYDHTQNLWNPKGQDLSRTLRPDETFETYLPTEPEGIGELKGDLVWRVHFRKGFNPKSMRGVTTLIEVVFNRNDIQPEAGRRAAIDLPTSTQLARR